MEQNEEQPFLDKIADIFSKASRDLGDITQRGLSAKEIEFLECVTEAFGDFMEDFWQLMGDSDLD